MKYLTLYKLLLTIVVIYFIHKAITTWYLTNGLFHVFLLSVAFYVGMYAQEKNWSKSILNLWSKLTSNIKVDYK